MNCGVVRDGSDKGRMYQGVPVCESCYEIAATLEARARQQMEILLTVQRDKIRQTIVEGRLSLNGLRKDEKLAPERIYPTVPEPGVPKGPDEGERGEPSSRRPASQPGQHQQLKVRAMRSVRARRVDGDQEERLSQKPLKNDTQPLDTLIDRT
jgi:hypothetical protein